MERWKDGKMERWKDGKMEKIERRKRLKAKDWTMDDEWKNTPAPVLLWVEGKCRWNKVDLTKDDVHKKLLRIFHGGVRK